MNFISALIAIVIGFVLQSAIIWVTWNAFIPNYFSLREVSFMEAMLINILAEVLFHKKENSK